MTSQHNDVTALSRLDQGPHLHFPPPPPLHNEQQLDVRLLLSPRMVPKMGVRGDICRGQGQAQSAGVNTDSRQQQRSEWNSQSRDTNHPIRQQILRNVDINRQVDTAASHSSKQQPLTSSAAGARALASNDVTQQQEVARGMCKSDSAHSVSRLSQTDDEGMPERREAYARYADVMYTNERNLEHTMAVQQRLFAQLLRKRGLPTSTSLPASPLRQAPPPSPAAVNRQQQQQADTKTLEWVVKRRVDGSRYITRRPVKDAQLTSRDRPEAASPAYVTSGDPRHWTTPDLDLNPERARERRRRKDVLQNVPQHQQLLKSKHQQQQQVMSPSLLRHSQFKSANGESGKQTSANQNKDCDTSSSGVLPVKKKMVRPGHKSRDTSGAGPRTNPAPLLSVTTV